MSGYSSLVATEFGEPGEVLILREVARRELVAGEIRIAVEAVGLNFLDVMMCRGTYPAVDKPPVTPGVEASGRVIEVGVGAESLLGRAVLACPTLPNGVLGEEVVIDAALAVPRPEWMDAVTAATLPVTYQTAWFALERARLEAGDSILITAGAGGVGTAVIQLARARGLTVIAAAGSAEKVAICLAQSADVVINYRDEDVAEVVRDVTGGGGVQAVIDPVSGPMTEVAMQSLANEGRLVLVGAAGGELVLDPFRLMALFTLIESGAISPVIDRVIALQEAPGALDDLAARRTVGKIVVDLRKPAEGTES
jgi:NADPH2:quinone reductase